MFLHLGADTVIPLRDVIAITDIKAARSGINDDFLRVMREENLIDDISDGNAKSFVVTDKLVFLSAISAATLKKRANFLAEDDED
jgi:chromosome segregation and condensation protein ScpB